MRLVTLKTRPGFTVRVNPDRVTWLSEDIISWGNATEPRLSQVVVHFGGPESSGLLLDSDYSIDEVDVLLTGPSGRIARNRQEPPETED